VGGAPTTGGVAAAADSPGEPPAGERLREAGVSSWRASGGGGSTGLRRNEPEEGVLGSTRTGRPPACNGRAQACRCVAFIGGRGSGTHGFGSAAGVGRAASECAHGPWQARLAGGR
jgi:hypothetical protein